MQRTFEYAVAVKAVNEPNAHALGEFMCEAVIAAQFSLFPSTSSG